ncbi:DNA polymerase III subunit beta [Peterkaempfera bronchialis]|uniref:DNA polymerase III subunit beta n=1 Tax=Peterkaempfera bronchialis TaxID=2126346 RepID=A0A345SYE6_9ACTN|nr:DNA polymerase III subunit beta [Peterkaempfera bronchialis]AXI78751.1 DNA polymerase III subunit beta [Peterkaempfera bronchialis]
MRFRIGRGAFAEAVAWAARALPARSPLPVLNGLLLEAADGRLTVSGYDHEVSARVAAEADTAGAGRVLVAGRRLLDVCRVLPEGPVECVREAARLAVACGGTRFGLAALPLDDYPALPPMPEYCGELDGAEFAAAVAQVAVAAGRDDTLPVLTGVRLALDGDTLTLAATNRYHFAVRTLRWRPQTSPGAAEAVVSARRLLDAARALADAGTVRVALGGGALGFEGGGASTTMRLLDGVLPRHAKLFTLDQPAVAVAERRPLIEAVKRMAVVTDRHSPVRLAFTADSVLLEAGAGDDDIASQRLPAALDGALGGAGMAVSFNPAYLADALGALDAPFVQFSLLGPGQRALLAGRRAQDGPADPAHRHLLMSLKTSG